MDNVGDVTLKAGPGDDFFGHSVASAGDVNGDGYSDVIVGAIADGVFVGHAYLYFGGPSMDNVSDVNLSESSTDSWFGSSVASAGDVNGDGYSDVIVGAPLADQAYVYFGGPGVQSGEHIVFTHATADELFGLSVASAGDVNGDGYADVIIGAPQDATRNNPEQHAYIYFGGSNMDNISDVTLTRTASDQDFFGSSVASAGDVNGDGYSDVIVGARGATKIYFGGVGMDNISDIKLTGVRRGFYNLPVASAGDVNGDGYSDVIISGSENAGRAYLYVSSSPPIVPRIAVVKDVPHDQGGKVTLRWIRSGYDAVGIAKITDYVIQRSLPPGISGLAWENIATFTATQDPVYAYTATTLYDSSASTNGLCYFRIVARTANPLELWKSVPIAGYSVDNLAPSAISFLSAEFVAPASVKLRWNKNALDPDLRYYAIYRATTDGFVPNPSLQIGTIVDTTFIDQSPVVGAKNYYRVVTFDIHDNASAPSPQASVLVTSVKEQAESLPSEFALFQNYPNPFNPETTIRFDLPQRSVVTLKLFNTLGKEVATLVNQSLPPGVHRIIFNAKNLTSGVYFYELRTEVFLQRKKMAVIK